MNANRNTKLRNDKAEVGIGTLIVFIAMILVAAVAAAVIVNTSGLLQSRALATGKASSDQVSSALEILEVYGTTTGAGNPITSLFVYVELQPGGQPINMQKLLIRWTDEAGNAEVVHGASASTTEYTDTWVKGSSDILEVGEVVKLEWTVALSEKEKGGFTIQPEAGVPTYMDFYAPATYGSDTKIQLA